MKRIALLGLLLLVLGSTSAMADIIKIGSPQPANSWTQQWSENGILGGILQPFNTVIVTMDTRSLEFLTVLTPGWTVNGTTMRLPGSQIGQFDFITTFEGTWSDKVAFYYRAYLDDTILSTQLARWDPDSGWSYEYPNNCVLAVPEPELSILFLAAIMAVFILAAITKR